VLSDIEGEMMKSHKVVSYSLGDIVDKMTILSLKIHFGEEDAISEHRYLEKSVPHGKLLTNAIRLAHMNLMIWNLENEIRKGGENKFTLEEIGRRALEIRDLNRRRIKYKNKINDMTRDFREHKINHRSQ